MRQCSSVDLLERHSQSILLLAIFVLWSNAILMMFLQMHCEYSKLPLLSQIVLYPLSTPDAAKSCAMHLFFFLPCVAENVFMLHDQANRVELKRNTHLNQRDLCSFPGNDLRLSSSRGNMSDYWITAGQHLGGNGMHWPEINVLGKWFFSPRCHNRK